MPSGQLSDSAQASQFAAGKILGLVGVCLEYVLQARRAQQLILHKYVLVLLVVCCREVSTAGDKQTGNSVHKAPLQPTLKPTSKLALCRLTHLSLDWSEIILNLETERGQ